MVKFYGQIGPQFMFLSNAAIKYYDSTGTAQASYITTRYGGILDTAYTVTGPAAKERFQKSNVGLNFGLGANISIIPSLYVNAGLSFYYGFSDINSDQTYANRNGTFSDNTWRWPDLSLGKYEASHNAYGGIDIGVHYMFLQ